jgi:RNA polymerase sigma-70 factor, ECF subfamily
VKIRTRKINFLDPGGVTMAFGGSSGTLTDDDHESLESLRTYLLWVAWRFQGSEGVVGAEGASDLVQQTMLVALKKAQEGLGPGPTAKDRKAWLRQILKNLMREKSRRSRRQPVEIEDSIADSGTSPSGTLARQEQTRVMAKALDQLAPDERELVLWRSVDGLSYEEIGRRKGYSASYARRAVGQVLGQLRSMLGEAFDGSTGA